MDVHNPESTGADLPWAGRLDGRIHLLPARVYYEDTDMSGVVYHAGYVRFFERGRSDFLRLIGVHHARLLERTPPLAFAITELDVRFLKAARIDDALLVHTAYDAIAGVRLQIGQHITRGADLIATARVEAVCIDLTGRPRRLPQDVRDLLQPLLLGE
jgi:acyl-CoA thioester hydrolase